MMTRILTGVGLVMLLAFAVSMGGWVFSVLFMISLCLCIYEVFRATKNAGIHPIEWPVWMCVLISIPAFIIYKQSYMVLLLMGCACILTCGYILFRKEPSLYDLMFSCLPLFSLVLPGMCMLSFQQYENRLMQTYFILLSFGIPLMGDTFALFIGRKWGKRPFSPRVSPNKTLEGALGGLLGSIVFALGLHLIYAIFTDVPPIWHPALVGLIGGILGQIGDLFASLEKRHCGIKDFGHLFPGHGGMMDRLDSVFFATLAVYLYSLMYSASLAGAL